ncbi:MULTISPECIES: enoyl-CoA hydratase [Psychrobacter]|jgi:enoyl-CoA hydratase/carnithine racemase|uniref:Enoyl-CoA hydratase n=1 Tax=Psychrobacter namhaensis TaxID=292734 RepID=A0ABW8L558_9GAMM|nr:MULTISPECIES: enoyl-CoA hydratase [unclassified Psychrobacter]TEW83135.1 enoyl-CoA hydratase [Psychrobacter sp. 230]|tara:strand:- start:1395 stop:2171 length:777 start_codon:yes stop_codon:yes gene_type:complete
MEEQIILTEQLANGICVITLNRPKVRNALNTELRQKLADIFIQLNDDPQTKAIVLTGGDKVFAAGADVNDFLTAKTVDVYLRHSERYWDAITNCRKPIIAAVNGYALGGGCELAMHTDIIVAGKSAKFGQPEIKIGLMPGAGGTQRLFRVIGKHKAMKLILTGDMISAEAADQMGLVSEVVDDETTIKRAIEIAKKLAGYSPIALMQIKEVANLGVDMPLQAALALERKAFQILFDTEDQKEGVKAFLEKRDANYKGQ